MTNNTNIIDDINYKVQKAFFANAPTTVDSSGRGVENSFSQFEIPINMMRFKIGGDYMDEEFVAIKKQWENAPILRIPVVLVDSNPANGITEPKLRTRIGYGDFRASTYTDCDILDLTPCGNSASTCNTYVPGIGGQEEIVMDMTMRREVVHIDQCITNLFLTNSKNQMYDIASEKLGTLNQSKSLATNIVNNVTQYIAKAKMRRHIVTQFSDHGGVAQVTGVADSFGRIPLNRTGLLKYWETYAVYRPEPNDGASDYTRNCVVSCDWTWQLIGYVGVGKDIMGSTTYNNITLTRAKDLSGALMPVVTVQENDMLVFADGIRTSLTFGGNPYDVALPQWASSQAQATSQIAGYYAINCCGDDGIYGDIALGIRAEAGDVTSYMGIDITAAQFGRLIVPKVECCSPVEGDARCASMTMEEIYHRVSIVRDMMRAMKASHWFEGTIARMDETVYIRANKWTQYAIANNLLLNFPQYASKFIQINGTTVSLQSDPTKVANLLFGDVKVVFETVTWLPEGMVVIGPDNPYTTLVYGNLQEDYAKYNDAKWVRKLPSDLVGIKYSPNYLAELESTFVYQKPDCNGVTQNYLDVTFESRFNRANFFGGAMQIITNHCFNLNGCGITCNVPGCTSCNS
jgi:hypothetical protein